MAQWHKLGEILHNVFRDQINGTNIFRYDRDDISLSAWCMVIWVLKSEQSDFWAPKQPKKKKATSPVNFPSAFTPFHVTIAFYPFAFSP